jgi:hypothetical protein
MKRYNAVTQEESMGCAVACVASILGISYKDSLKKFGIKSAENPTFYCKDIASILNKSGLSYDYGKLIDKKRKYLSLPGTIVFLRRSSKFPVGHFILRAKEGWMNPWVNVPKISPAKSGFERVLPGEPQWIIYPVN